MTNRTVTAFYDSRADAELARRRLTEAGISESQISLHAQEASGSTSQSGDNDGFWASLKDIFLPDEDRHTYAEGLRRGGVLLSVRAPEAQLDTAVHMLEKTNAVDVETRASEWQSAGWTGYSRREGMGTGPAMSAGTAAPMPIPPDATAVPAVGSSSHMQGQAQASSTTAMRGSAHEEAIPIVQEELRVGKREVERGSVRVRSYIVETPVQEEVHLRDETVHVERRPVDRELRPGDMAAFQDKSISVTETDEEAVVAKTARVKEELVIRKDVTQQTETIRDTVRHTEVEVEDSRSDLASASSPLPRASQGR